VKYTVSGITQKVVVLCSIWGYLEGFLQPLLQKLLQKSLAFCNFCNQRGHGKSQNNHDGTPTLTPPNQSNEAENAGRIVKSK